MPEIDLTNPPTKPAACYCFSEDAGVARKQKRTEVARLIGESHFSVTLERCDVCGSWFLRVFTEIVDWLLGDDSQCWVYCPLEPAEAERLLAEADRVTERYINGLGITRRMLTHDWPTQREPITAWFEQKLSVDSHD